MQLRINTLYSGFKRHQIFIRKMHSCFYIHGPLMSQNSSDKPDSSFLCGFWYCLYTLMQNGQEFTTLIWSYLCNCWHLSRVQWKPKATFIYIYDIYLFIFIYKAMKLLQVIYTYIYTCIYLQAVIHPAICIEIVLVLSCYIFALLWTSPSKSVVGSWMKEGKISTIANIYCNVY